MKNQIELIALAGIFALSHAICFLEHQFQLRDASGISRSDAGEIVCPHCQTATEQHWPYTCSACGWKYD